MRILHVLHQFLPQHVGGVDIYVKNISKELSLRGNDVRVFCGHGQIMNRPSVYNSTVEDIEIIHIEDSSVFVPSKGDFFRTFQNGSVLKIFKQVVCDFMPDIVHFHHTMYLSGDMLCFVRSKKIPVVLTAHDFWFLCHKLHLVDWKGNQCSGVKYGFKCAYCVGQTSCKFIWSLKAFIFLIPLVYRTWYQRKILQSCDFIISPAVFLVDILKQRIGTETKIKHIPYGIPSIDTFPVSIRRNKMIRFGYLGTIKRHKGLHIIIEAFNKLINMNATLSIYGDTTVDLKYFNELKQKYIGNKVHFKGAYQNHHIAKVFDEIDVLIVPSIWRETGPFVILEALANRKPVIASNLGGMTELIRNGENGFIFEHGNSQSLLESIVLILNRPNILELLSIQLAKEHSLINNVNTVLDVYINLLATQRIQ